MRKTLTVLFMMWVLPFFVVCDSRAAPMGTAFTYQGRLIDANNAADGIYDFAFKIYDASVAGTQKGRTINIGEVDVIDGYFTAELDFSNMFDGNDRWLQIGVRAGELKDPNAYTTLAPRQEVTPTPYALYAKTAGGGGSLWQVNGTSIYYNNGKVGIGTSNPAAKLDVSGDINAASVYKIGGSTVLSAPGTQNTLVGLAAGAVNTGSGNTFTGYQAGYSNTTGNYNTFSGGEAGYYNTTGNCNTFLGFQAGLSNTTGYGNTFSGVEAGVSNTTGSYNTFSGYDAGIFNTTGSYNTFSGYRAGNLNTTGGNNTFSGYRAGANNTTGNYNTFSGYQAGYYNTTGYNNTFSGTHAGAYNTTGYNNTFSGNEAGYYNTTGGNNTFSGFDAGYSNTTGNENTFSGLEAGYSNTTGGNNTFSGTHAGAYNTTGYNNTFSGNEAGYTNTTGYNNTFSGASAGQNNTTGSGNVFIGYAAGYNETGSNKLYIANSSGTPLIYGDFSTSRVGIHITDPTESLDVQGTARLRGIGSSSGTTVVADGNGKLWKASSSKRYKTNIATLDADTDAVLKLRPVRFQWRTTGQNDIGLIAEEVEQQLNDLVIYDNEGRPDAVKYDRVSLYLLEVVKDLKAENESLKQRLEDIEAKMQKVSTSAREE